MLSVDVRVNTNEDVMKILASTFITISLLLSGCTNSVVFVDRYPDAGTTQVNSDSSANDGGVTADATPREVNYRFGGPSVGPERAVSSREEQGSFVLALPRGSNHVVDEQLTLLREMAAAQNGNEYVVAWVQETLGRRSLRAAYVAPSGVASRPVLLDPNLVGDAEPQVVVRNNTFTVLWTRRAGINETVATALCELTILDGQALLARPLRTVLANQRASNMIVHGGTIYGYFFESGSTPGLILMAKYADAPQFNYTRISWGSLGGRGRQANAALRLRQTDDDLLIVGWGNRVFRVPFAELERPQTPPLTEANLPPPLVAPEGHVVVDVFPGPSEWVFVTAAALRNSRVLQAFLHGVRRSAIGEWTYDVSLPEVMDLRPNDAWRPYEGPWFPNEAWAAAKLFRAPSAPGVSRVMLRDCIGGHGCPYQTRDTQGLSFPEVVVGENQIVRVDPRSNVTVTPNPFIMAENAMVSFADEARLQLDCVGAYRERKCRLALFQADREITRMGPVADQIRPVVVAAGSTVGVSLVHAGKTLLNVELANTAAALPVGLSASWSDQIMGGMQRNGIFSVHSVQQSLDPSNYMRRRVVYELRGNAWIEAIAYDDHGERSDYVRCGERSYFAEELTLDIVQQSRQLRVTAELADGSLASSTIADPNPRGFGLWVMPWESGCALIRGQGDLYRTGAFVSATAVGVQNNNITFGTPRTLLTGGDYALRPQATNAGIAIPVVLANTHAASSIALLQANGDPNRLVPLGEFSWRAQIGMSSADERYVGFQHMSSDGATVMVLRRNGATIEGLRFDLNGRELFRGPIFTMSETPEVGRDIETTGWIAAASKSPGVFHVAYQRYSSEHGAYRVYVRELRFLDEVIP